MKTKVRCDSIKSMTHLPPLKCHSGSHSWCLNKHSPAPRRPPARGTCARPTFASAKLGSTDWIDRRRLQTQARSNSRGEAPTRKGKLPRGLLGVLILKVRRVDWQACPVPTAAGGSCTALGLEKLVSMYCTLSTDGRSAHGAEMRVSTRAAHT